MTSNDKTPRDTQPRRPQLRLVILILLVILALGDALLLFYLHHHRAHKPAVAPVSTTVPQTETVPAPSQRAGLPSFDIVRVDANGNALLAGRADPGSTVTVKDGNNVLGTVVADSHGEFILLPDTKLAPGTHEITLSETLPDGKVIESAQNASIDLPGSGKAVLAVVSGPGGSQVVTDQGPQPGQLAMGAVDYDTHGHALFSGTAPTGATVTVMLGGKPLGKAQADSSGRWRLTAPTPTAPGIITLNGTTMTGEALPPVSVPFAPEQLSAALDDGRVVIEPGDNLWMIARKVYGKGIMYTLIYSANESEIHNPNLIFPGQDFVLPKK